MSRCYHCGHILEDKNAACPNCLPNFYGRGKETGNTAGWIKIPEANLRAIEAENADLKELLREIYNSIPATYDENDSMVKRHARALNEIKKILDRER